MGHGIQIGRLTLHPTESFPDDLILTTEQSINGAAPFDLPALTSAIKFQIDGCALFFFPRPEQ